MKQGYVKASVLPFIIMSLSTILMGCGDGNKKVERVEEAEIGAKPKRTDIEKCFYADRMGQTGYVYPQWLQSDSLSKHATTAELVAMASKHGDPVEQLVAFRALLMKEPKAAVNLVISEIDDTTKVIVCSGCSTGEECVSDTRISMVQYNREEYHVTKEDSMRIDSALLMSDNAPLYSYSYSLFNNLPAKPEMEGRLRQLYTRDQWALVALARLHRQKDKQEIIRLLSQIGQKDLWTYRDTTRMALHAAAAWPDEAFKPSVQKVCRKFLDNSWESNGCTGAVMRVLIAYNSKWSYDMIDKGMASAKAADRDYFIWRWSLHEEYKANPSPLFKPLLRKYPLDY